MDPRSTTVTKRADDTLVLRAGSADLADYVYRSAVPQLESPRPYLHPLATLSGVVTTGFRPDDHPWHAGLSWALPVVGHENFWGGPSFRGTGYTQLPNNGTQRHVGFESSEPGEIREEIHWMTQAGAAVFEESRRISARAAADHWTLVFDSELRNVSGSAVDLGSPSTEGRPNAGYGGLFWRGAEAMLNGTVFTAAGETDESAMGSTADWMAYSTPDATVVMVDDAANPRHPTPWFVRTSEYPGLCPAPFFSTVLPVPADAGVRFRYAVVVADGGSDLERASLLADRGRAAAASMPLNPPSRKDPS
jgi:hypothetical protein